MIAIRSTRTYDWTTFETGEDAAVFLWGRDMRYYQVFVMIDDVPVSVGKMAKAIDAAVAAVNPKEEPNAEADPDESDHCSPDPDLQV